METEVKMQAQMIEMMAQYQVRNKKGKESIDVLESKEDTSNDEETN